MPAAARVGDYHTCPQVTGNIRHTGGNIAGPGSYDVFINGLPAALVGSTALCNGPNDTIVKGSSSVLINGNPVARVGDMTAHGGIITGGSDNVLIGG